MARDDNPLSGTVRGSRRGTITRYDLECYAAALNRKHWVQAMGKKYFVATRLDENGEEKGSLDCIG